MSTFHFEGESKLNEEDEKQGDQLVPSDEEDDCEGFFLEPVGSNVNIAEKIAEANKKLLEEEEEEEDESRPRKVQFSDNLVNFEPAYYSDDDYTESARNSIVSEEDSEIKLSEVPMEKTDATQGDDITDVDTEPEDIKTDEIEEIPEEIVKDVISLPNNFSDDLTDRNAKFILVLLPKEQNSSCESIIGEEIPGQIEEKEVKPESENSIKVKLARPKSAKKSCEVSKISPNLNYSSNIERKSWQTTRNPLLKAKKLEAHEKKGLPIGEMKVEVKGRGVKKINIGDLENIEPEKLKRCCDNRPKSSFANKEIIGGTERPKTAPMRRTCCVIKTELPRYNGLRSEYGLSAEQLEERKQESLKIAKQKRQDKLKERQEEMRKREKNEEIFQKWLFNKTKKSVERKIPKLMDTLTRSDIYIQTHAVYASKRSVPYAVDYNVNRKLWENRLRQKKIIVEKFFDKVSPYFKRSFNIYLGGRR